jgi:TrmH family RNA methyltransferase
MPLPAPQLITSAQNPRIKGVLALRKRAERDRSRQMLVDGYDELAVALNSGARPASLYYCPALVRDQAQTWIVTATQNLGTEVFQLSEAVFRRIAYREAPDGWLAVLPAIETGLGRLRLGQDPLLLVCESVEKPGNLGAMLRTADAAGVDAVISSPTVTDWGNPNVVRASKGAVFSVPVAESAPEELIAWLRGQGIAIVAATLESEIPYTAASLKGGVAIVVGAESGGLSETWLQAADVEVRIPMFGRLNSLNVATSAALLVYEAIRQRGQVTTGG